MFQDCKDLLSSFNDHGVTYLVIGDDAVSSHAQPRATKDNDIFIKSDAATGRALYAALAAFGAPLNDMPEADFCDPQTFLRFGREPRAVDILAKIDGMDFETAWENRIDGVIDQETALKARFISGSDLIIAKLAAGKPQDIADTVAIRTAAEANHGTR